MTACLLGHICRALFQNVLILNEGKKTRTLNTSCQWALTMRQDCARHSYLIQSTLQLLGLNDHYSHFEDEQDRTQIMPVTDSRSHMSKWYYQDVHPALSDFRARIVNSKICDFWVRLKCWEDLYQGKEQSPLGFKMLLEVISIWVLISFSP